MRKNKNIFGGYLAKKSGINPDDKNVRYCKKYGWIRLNCNEVQILEYCHKIENFKIIDYKSYTDLYKK